ncbi:hypothetical protein ABPG77_000480 [Micractinium sp. CCAP 211/92]
MAARFLLLCGLLGAAAASKPPVTLEVGTLALVHGVVKGLAHEEACATVTVQLGAVAQQAAACPDNTGTAAFAVPLTVGAGASTQPASLLVSSAGRQWRQMAVALAFLLLRQHGSGESQSAGAADDNTSAPSEDGAAASPRWPERRLSLRDACTSPLVILASPFVGTKRQAAEAAAALDSIAEDRDEGALAAAEPTAMEPQQDGWQRQAASARQTAAHASLPTPPNGWTRDAWGRLQRLSGGGASKPAHGLLHPPPFGAAAGTAFRFPASEE